MPSIFKKKAQHAEDAKLVMMRAAAIAPAELKSWITIVTSFVWAKNFRMAELRCRQHIDVLDQFTEIRDLLCTILPEFARFVDIRKKAGM
ncbi:MAG TPA: hypothetical protein PKM25_12210 [Candidatus Ozemobacteraceae bacterium]|nr:hypothetical protein [Candidatus Ozemobacteraceae bacterium]